MKHYTNEEYMKMYHDLSFARYYYYVFEELASRGVLPGFHHLGLGAEACCMGISEALGENDWLCIPVRTQPAMALKFGVKEYLAELLGKRTGFAGGLAGESHYTSLSKKTVPLSALLGATPSMATGIAHAYKMDNVDGCVVIGCGDGALNEGLISESLNFIAAWKLPVVWYVDNNDVALSTSVKYATGLDSLADRARGFGIPARTIDGTNILEVRSTMEELIEKAKKGEPQFVEIKTERWLGHFVGDPDLCRDPDVVVNARANKDPLKYYRNFLIAKKIATAAELDAIDKKYDEELHEAVDAALQEPNKTWEDIHRPVLAEEYKGGAK